MIINNSGGGAPLNFKVVGGTAQPTSPSENTIWVNTASPITSWVFSTEQPANPAEGMLWFISDGTGNTPINALKKNQLWLNPTSCRQYVGGAWESKNAMAYQNGTWQDVKFLVAWMFNEGDLGLSGGFSASAGTLTVTNEIVHTMSSGTYAYITSNNPIDLSDFSTLTFHCINNGIVKEYAYVGVGTTKSQFVAETAAAQTSYADVLVDVSNLSGLHYVGFKNKSYSENNGCKLQIKYIKLS